MRFNAPHSRLALIALCLMATLTAVAFAQPPNGGDALAAVVELEQVVAEVIARAEPSVVAVARSAPHPESNGDDIFHDFRPRPANDSTITGAGVVIDPAGFVLTQYLAVHEGDAHVVITTDGVRHSAILQAADPRSGLAVLKLDQKPNPSRGNGEQAVDSPAFRALRFANASTLRKGQFVIVLGNPYAVAADGQPTASWGIIANIARKAPPGTNFNDTPGPNQDFRTTIHHLGTLIQTDARLGFSTGGGALVNLRGELVGITTTAATIAGHEQPAGYAIPMNATMQRVIETLKQGREVEYGMLGVGFGATVAAGDNADRRMRLSISQVYPGSPAARAGLREGDTIIRVGDTPVGDIDSLQLAIGALAPDTATTIAYKRGDRTATASVTLAKLAVAGKRIARVRPEAWHGLRVDYASALDAPQLAQAIVSGAYDADGCVLVTEVELDSDSWRAGIRPGMFISHVGSKRVTSPAEFQAAARALPANAFEIELTQPVAAKINLEERPKK